MFSRIVPAFTSQNIGSLAPLTVISLVYGVVGAAMAWIIRCFFWVPHRFRYGILAAGGWGNYGDIRTWFLPIFLQTQQDLRSATAIAMGITASAPFAGVDDQNLAIAYISMIILIFSVRFLSRTRVICLADALKITLFPLGGFLLIAKDFEGPDVDSEELRERMHLRRRRLAAMATCLLGRFSRLFRHSEQACDTESGSDFQEKDTISHNESMGSKSIISQKTLTSTPPSPTSDKNMDFTPLETHGHSADRRPSCRLYSRLRHFLAELLKPIPIVIFLSLVIALVDPLKALFLPPSGSFQPRVRPAAPDGQPPLAFVLDTASFVGAASVPIGLICLGSALACLRLRSGETFPQGAITALALARMVVTPLLGVGITRWFVHAGFVDRDDKVLQFVCMYVSRPGLTRC